ncbi:hypothetical protein HDU99_001568, partial [Rhizoclosmatium hyalinum]
EMTSTQSAWTLSYFYHDVAKYIDTNDATVYTKCLTYFGLKMLDNVKPETGETPFGVAVREDNIEFVTFMISNQSYLHIAARRGSPRMIKIILDFFLENNMRDDVDRFNLDGENAYSICKTLNVKNASAMFGVQDTESVGGEPLNILLVGISQSGKSTLIKYLHEYNGLLCPPIGIGDGENSETAECKMYRFRHQYKEFFPFIGKKGKRIIQKNITQSAETNGYKGNHLKRFLSTAASHTAATDLALFKENNLEIHEVIYLKSAREVCLMDTPGLCDSKDQQGTDENHILSILDYLDQNSIHKLHAVILVIKPGLQSEVVKSTVKYYFNLFKNNAGCIYTVFTHFDLKKRKEIEKKGITVTELRQRFLAACGVTTKPYIYNVDLIPPSTIDDLDDRQYAMEYLNGLEINKLFSNISVSQRFIRTKDIEFEKTKRILSREIQFKDYIKGVRVGCENGVSQFHSSAAIFLQKYNEMSNELAEKEKKLKTTLEWIERHDNDQLFVLKEKIFKEPFSLFYNRVPFEFEHTGKDEIHYPIDVQKWRGVSFEYQVKQSTSIKITFKSHWFQPQDAHVK